jgi:hypothetical protein
MLRGFLVSQFTDEFPGGISGLPAQYTMPSWNVRDVMAGSNNGVFPLLVTSLPGTVTTQSLSGSGNYFRLTRLAASPATTFRMLGPAGSALTSPGARVYLVRLR